MEHEKLYRAAISVWGTEHQTKKTFEEIGEFIEAICKCAEHRDKAAHVAEEIADVQIMLEQMTVLYGIEKEVEAFRESKLSYLDLLVHKEGPGCFTDCTAPGCQYCQGFPGKCAKYEAPHAKMKCKIVKGPCWGPGCKWWSTNPQGCMRSDALERE